MSQTLREELKTLLPGRSLKVYSAPESWGREERGAPPLVAPESEEEVAAVLTRASLEGWKVRAGGNCSHPPWSESPDLVLSTRGLGAMVGYEPADLTFTAQAGISWTTLQRTTREQGQWLPLDPPGVMAGTLGGVVATGLSGSLRHAYGAPRDHILGITLVSGDGRILRWGGRVVKNVAGFDITRLAIGSWGSLGVVTSVSARLFPLPKADLTVLVTGPGPEELLPIARSLAFSNLPLAAVEVVDPGSGPVPWSMPESDLSSGEAPTGHQSAALIIRGLSSETQTKEMEARVFQELASEGRGSGGSLVSLWGEESQALHRGLEVWEEEGADLSIRLSLLPSAMGTLFGEVGVLGEGLLGRPKLAAHIGWGVLRASFSELPSSDDALGELGVRLESLRSRLEGEGGTLVVSRGPRALFERVGPPAIGESVSKLIKGLRSEFDPAGILSPGRWLG